MSHFTLTDPSHSNTELTFNDVIMQSKAQGRKTPHKNRPIGLLDKQNYCASTSVVSCYCRIVFVVVRMVDL